MWKSIKLNNKYKINIDGTILNTNTGKVLKPIISNGYKKISINRKQYRIHRLLAEAFIPNPNNYPIINHKDENKLNNSLLNLEWCTHSYNVNYGTANSKRTGRPRKNKS